MDKCVESAWMKVRVINLETVNEQLKNEIKSFIEDILIDMKERRTRENNLMMYIPESFRQGVTEKKCWEQGIC